MSKRAERKLRELAAGPLFDDDGAGVLTRWLPLSMQIQAAHSKILSSRLRGQVALARGKWREALQLSDADGVVWNFW